MILETSIFNNTIQEYLIAIAIFLFVSLLGFIIRHYVLRIMKEATEKTKSHWDDVLFEGVKTLGKDFYYALGALFAVHALTLPDIVFNIVVGTLWLIIIYRLVDGIRLLVNHGVETTLGKATDKNNPIVQFVKNFSGWIIWILAIILLLSNLGVNVTSFVAGLGIAGLAIAFALQEVFKDLFATFSIFADKLFKEGDYLATGEYSGTVIHIGLRTTRLATVVGTELIVPNNYLTSTLVENSRIRKERRVEFSIPLDTKNTHKKMESALQIIKDVIEINEKLRLERVGFSHIGLEGYVMEGVYYVASPLKKVEVEEVSKVVSEVSKRYAEKKISFSHAGVVMKNKNP